MTGRRMAEESVMSCGRMCSVSGQTVTSCKNRLWNIFVSNLSSLTTQIRGQLWTTPQQDLWASAVHRRDQLAGSSWCLSTSHTARQVTLLIYYLLRNTSDLTLPTAQRSIYECRNHVSIISIYWFSDTKNLSFPFWFRVQITFLQTNQDI